MLGCYPQETNAGTKLAVYDYWNNYERILFSFDDFILWGELVMHKRTLEDSKMI